MPLGRIIEPDIEPLVERVVDGYCSFILAIYALCPIGPPILHAVPIPVIQQLCCMDILFDNEDQVKDDGVGNEGGA